MHPTSEPDGWPKFKHVDGLDHGEYYAPTPGLDMVKAVLNHASASMLREG